MKILFACILIIPILLAACAPVPSGKTEPVYAKSDKVRDAQPQVDEALLTSLVDANTRFALKFYDEINDREGNIIFSPLSLSMALSMTLAGAQGTTKTEMQNALSVEGLDEETFTAFNALLLALESSMAKKTPEEQGDAFQLNIANSTWTQSGFPILPEFLDTLALNYDAGMYSVDYINDAEGARQAINDWVNEETNSKIPDLIPEGALDALTRLVLANAIYFKGSWLNQFDEDATLPADFTLLDGSKTSVDMMHLYGEDLQYTKGEDFQLLRLPYLSSDFSMLLLVPDEGAFSEVESALDAEKLTSYVGKMQYSLINLSMPKFDFESSVAAPDPLKALGMLSAFDPDRADFSGISTEQMLYISDVIHKATITVDEEGTEAAAATAVIMALTSAPMDEPIDLVIDRPFMFAIEHQPTGTILFLGRVVNP